MTIHVHVINTITAHKYNIQLYGGEAILGIAVASAQTRLRFNRPQISFSRMDFGRHMEVASLEATEEMMAVASFPQAHQPRGHIHTCTHPSSEHFGSLD